MTAFTPIAATHVHARPQRTNRARLDLCVVLREFCVVVRARCTRVDLRASTRVHVRSVNEALLRDCSVSVDAYANCLHRVDS